MKQGIVSRSSKLESIAYPYCTYANEIMVKTAMDRFVYGKSCSIISLQENICWISESNVRNITDMTLGIFSRIHGESYKKIKNHINSYAL